MNITRFCMSMPSDFLKRLDEAARKAGFVNRSEFIRSVLSQHLAQSQQSQA